MAGSGASWYGEAWGNYAKYEKMRTIALRKERLLRFPLVKSFFARTIRHNLQGSP